MAASSGGVGRGKRGAGGEAGAAQVSMEDDVHRRRDEQIAVRLDTLSNFVADLEAKLPGWRRELDTLREELRSR